MLKIWRKRRFWRQPLPSVLVKMLQCALCCINHKGSRKPKVLANKVSFATEILPARNHDFSISLYYSFPIPRFLNFVEGQKSCRTKLPWIFELSS